MARICPTCQADLGAGARHRSPWLPIVTALGVSAAAYFVYRHVAKGRDRSMEAILDHCARAASALDRRLGDSVISIAS